MTTALTLYGGSTATVTLTTAAALFSGTGGTQTNNSTKLGTATGFGQVYGLGTTNAWLAHAAGAITDSACNPDGNGWLFDVTTLEGQQIIAGNWKPVFSFKTVGTSSVITADLYVRAFKRSSSGVYTLISTAMLLSGQTINTTQATYTWANTSLSTMSFATGDKLYIDCWFNVTANTNGLSGLKISAFLSLSTTQGVAGLAEVDTPGYQPIPSTTALTLYGGSTATATLSTAAALFSGTGGSQTNNSTKLGTAIGFGQVFGLGTTGAWLAHTAGAITDPACNPDGSGWLFDVTSLEGQQIIAGNWKPIFSFKTVGTGSSITADMYVRAFKRSSAGVYTLIGSAMLLSGQTINTTQATYTWANSSLAAMTFATGDKLYIDCWFNVLTNSNGLSALKISAFLSLSTTQGVAGLAEVDTPGYQPTGGVTNPALATSPTTLSFSATAGGANPASQNDTLSETAGVGTAWTSSISYGSGSGWLGMSPASGSLAANGTQAITCTCTTGSLAAGTYSATVTFSATTGGATAIISVTFTVSAAGVPALSTSPTSLSFSALVGGSNPASQNSTLAETAGVATAWTSSISYGSGSGWLALSPTSGTLAANGNRAVAYTCTTASLAAGSYSATVTFTATSGGATATVSVTFTVSSANSASPYGVTVAIFNSNLYQYPDQLFPDCATLHIGAIRFQQSWAYIETSRGVYNWGPLDDFVGRCNAAGIIVQFPIRTAPDWYTTVLANPGQTNRTTCNANTPNDRIFQMDPTATANFAALVASRYNGSTIANTFKPGSFLFIDAIEIGNEDFDFKFDCNAATGVGYLGQEARLAKWYIPVVQQAAPLIRANSPKSLIGMFGSWWKDIVHRKQFITDLYNAKDGSGKSIASYLDYFNFHCYIGDPNVDINTLNVSLPHILTQLNSVVQSFGDTKHFAITEIGWAATEFTGDPTDPTQGQIATYYQNAMDIMRTSGIVDRFNLFTMAYNPGGADIPAGKSITQQAGASPHFWPAATAIQSYAAAHPSWTSSGGGGGGGGGSAATLATSPTTLSFSAIAGRANPASQNSTLSETAGVATAWTSSISYGSGGSGWLSISPASGNVAASGHQVVTFSCTTGSLAVGVYTATVTFTAATGGATATVGVTFTVSSVFGSTPHVCVIALENHSYANTSAKYVKGNPNFPHINALLSTYGYATNFFGISHPSLPNYISFACGSTKGVTIDGYNPFTSPLSGNTLADSLDGASIGWKHYAEYLPSSGYLGSWPSGTGDSGTYPSLFVAHHCPWIYFQNFRTATTSYQQSHLVSLDASPTFSNLSTALNNGTAPPFLFIQPGNDHNGHTGSDSACDNYINSLVATIQASTWYTSGNGQIILWWDESNPDADNAGIGDANPGGGHVLCVVIRSGLAGKTLTSNINHYGMLSALETLYGISKLGNSAHSSNGDLSPLLSASSGTAPILSTSPTSLSFSAVAGGSNPASQNDTLSETAGTATAWTSSISYGSGSGWLGMSPASGSLAANGTQTVAFSCTTGSLAAGTYSATVTYTATSGGATATVGVTFVVHASGTPALTTSPGTLSFSAVAGGSNPASQNSTLAEIAGVGTAWTSSISYVSGSGWLSRTPTSGTLAASGNQAVSFTCTTGSLPAGIYAANVTFTATTGGATTTVAVTFTVTTAPTPVLSTSPTGLAFGATVGSANPASQNSTLSETAGVGTNWTSSISYSSGGSGWLSLSPASGTLSASGNQAVSFTCTTGSLPAGNYSATVRFTATTGGATATVGVSFAVASLSPYVTATLAKRPKAYYRLDESSGLVAHDSSGNGYDAAITADTTLSQPGLIARDADTCMRFTPTGGLSLPPALAQQIPTWSAISLDFWIKFSGKAQYVAAVCNGSTTLLYLDGDPYTTGSGDPIVLGSLFDFMGSYESASIDEVGVYDYPLSLTQIAVTRQVGSGGTIAPSDLLLFLPDYFVAADQQVQSSVGNTIYVPRAFGGTLVLAAPDATPYFEKRQEYGPGVLDFDAAGRVSSIHGQNE